MLTEIQVRILEKIFLSIIPVTYIAVKIAVSQVNMNWENCQNKRLKHELNEVITWKNRMPNL